MAPHALRQNLPRLHLMIKQNQQTVQTNCASHKHNLQH